jgi:hypothetical protein
MKALESPAAIAMAQPSERRRQAFRTSAVRTKRLPCSQSLTVPATADNRPRARTGALARRSLEKARREASEAERQVINFPGARRRVHLLLPMSSIADRKT